MVRARDLPKDIDTLTRPGAVGEIRAAAVASMPQATLAELVRRIGESWCNLLLRLYEAVMQSVVENCVIKNL